MACWLDFPSGVQAKGLGDHTNGHLCAWAGQIQNTVTQNQLNLRSTHTHKRQGRITCDRYSQHNEAYYVLCYACRLRCMKRTFLHHMVLVA